MSLKPIAIKLCRNTCSYFIATGIEVFSQTSSKPFELLLHILNALSYGAVLAFNS
jgi:hypothetical protein